MRRCFSHCDLTSVRRLEGQTDNNTLDYGSRDSCDLYEDIKPLKRSRSDQSLTTTSQLAGTPTAAISTASANSVEPNTAAQQYSDSHFSQQHSSYALHGKAFSYGQLSKVHRFPSLPVVLSDVGSSCNSLLSLDSEPVKSIDSQSHAHLRELLGSPAAGRATTSVLAAGVPVASPASIAASGILLSPGDAAFLSSAADIRRGGTFYALNNSDSAVSLTQAQHAYADLERTASDGSLNSAGGYLASLQQLVPPLPPYSPPPLFSPAPQLPPQLLSQGSGSLPLPGFAFGLKGGSILLQKQADFQPPVLAVTAERAEANSGHGRVRGVMSIGSMDSADSITSVEAGEHFVRMAAYGTHSPTSTTAAALTAASPAGTATTSDAALQAALEEAVQAVEAACASKEQHRQQPQQQQSSGTSSQASQANPAVARSTSVSKSYASPLPPPGPSRSALASFTSLPRPGSSNSIAAKLAAAAANAAASSSEAASKQLPQAHQLQTSFNLESAKSLLGSGSIELQGMGSMLGNEGEQWLVWEGSSGAIGLSPSHSNGKAEAAAQQPLSGAVAGTQPQITAGTSAATHTGSGAIAAAAAGVQAAETVGNVFKAHPVGVATSSSVTSTASAVMPAQSSRSFGFGAASVAAAAGKMGIFSAGAAAAGAAAAKAAFMPQQQPQQELGAAVMQAVQDGSSRAPLARQQQSAFANGGAAAEGHPANARQWSAQAGAQQQQQQGVWQSEPLPAASHVFASRGQDGSTAGNNWSHSGSQYYQQQMQQQSSTLRDAANYPWSFQRRPASFDCARPSSRRRGSLELNMPWRSKLDAVIAQVVNEAPESAPGIASLQSVSSTATDMSGDLGSIDGGSAIMIEPSEPLPIEAGDPFGTEALASGADFVRTDAEQHAMQQRPSALDLLLPVHEQGDKPVVGLADLGKHKDGDAALQVIGRAMSSSSSGPSSTKRTSSSSSSSGASVAADHDLPGSTNIGGYIGVDDALGTAAAGLEDAGGYGQSYGLEVDGAMMLQSVEPAGQLQGAIAESGGSSSRLSSHQGHYHSKHYGSKHGLSPEQEQQIAKLGSAQVESRLRHAVAGQQQHRAEQQQQEDVSADDHMRAVATAAAAASGHHQQVQQQQQRVQRHMQQNVVVVVEVDENSGSEDEGTYSHLKQLDGSSKTNVAPAVTSAIPAEQANSVFNGLQSATSIGSSVSSISSRSGAGFYNRRGAGSSSSGAAYELFVRLNRARQTLDFAKRQAQAFAELDKAELGVWEALDLLNTLREYEAALLVNASGSGRNSSNGGGGAGFADSGDLPQHSVYGSPLVSQGSLTEEPLTPDMSMKEYALQVAELCRLSFPDKPWMALIGLLHGLGKLLAHPQWGSQPQWAVAGESYPVGCRFAPQISHSEFFSANPDRRRRTLSTALGIYTANCGLRNVYMSWGAPEYLYMALVLNQTNLPEEALFMVRYHRCTAITRPGGAYRHLMSESDKALLPLLAAFQSLVAYRRVRLPPEALKGQKLIDYYDHLIVRYLGEEKLFW